jgi:23S rRNA (uracil1939-C5)-methyltransferase
LSRIRGQGSSVDAVSRRNLSRSSIARGPASAVEVRAVIDGLANGGDGVAVVEVGGERRAIFVRHAVPGDKAWLSVDLTTRPAKGRIVRLEAAGPDRVDPPCPHSLRCGGCAWMHLSVAGQVEAHRHRIRATLPDAWKDVPLELHPPDQALRYRTRARLHARASGGRAEVGMQEAKTHEPVEVDRCVVLHPAVEQARLALPPLLEGAKGRGEAQVALGVEGKPVLELLWRGTLARETFARLEEGVKTRAWAGARVFEGEVSRPAVCGDPTPWVMGADGAPLGLSPGGFAQASDETNRRLGARALALAQGVLGPALGEVIELFAGAGNFTVLLARHAGRLVAVESNEAACDALRRNLATRGLTAKVAEGLAEEYPIPRGADLVVLDPPRTGARRVMDRLLQAQPRAIVYVSCDVPTLSRDLACLDSAYAPVALEAFAMFAHTSHVETLAVLQARSQRPGGARPGASEAKAKGRP